MTENEFNGLVDNVFHECKAVLIKKGKEYNPHADRLREFYIAARMSNRSAPQALMGFKLKHDISVTSIVEQAANGVYAPKEVLQEKVVDSINYLVLLYALMRDIDVHGKRH